MSTSTADTLDLGAPSRAALAPAPAAPVVAHLPSRRPDGQAILSVRATIPKAEAGAFVAAALCDVRAYMQEHHLRAAGPPFSICRPRGDALDVEAGWPVAAPVSGTGRIHGGELPRSLVSTALIPA